MAVLQNFFRFFAKKVKIHISKSQPRKTSALHLEREKTPASATRERGAISG
jgi:hypothetical protein